MSASYQEYREHREQAAKLRAKGDFQEALKEIELAIMAAPDAELLSIAESVRKEIAPKASPLFGINWFSPRRAGRATER